VLTAHAATHALLVPAGSESSVDKLLKQIGSFMSDIADDFKVRQGFKQPASAWDWRVYSMRVARQWRTAALRLPVGAHVQT
jgi:hypothetical protein